MKLCSLSKSALLALAVVALIASSQGASGALRGADTNDNEHRSLQESGSNFHLTPLHYEGCIQAQGKAMASRAILATETPFCTSFTLDNDGLIHASGSNLCLQAGHGRMMQDGSKLRLYPCDRMSMFQRFAWTGRDGKLKLKTLKYDDLCLTFRGDNADINDPIIFKKCMSIPSTHIQWQGKKISEITVGL